VPRGTSAAVETVITQCRPSPLRAGLGRVSRLLGQVSHSTRDNPPRAHTQPLQRALTGAGTGAGYALVAGCAPGCRLGSGPSARLRKERCERQRPPPSPDRRDRNPPGATTTPAGAIRPDPDTHAYRSPPASDCRRFHAGLCTRDGPPGARARRHTGWRTLTSGPIRTPTPTEVPQQAIADGSTRGCVGVAVRRGQRCARANGGRPSGWRTWPRTPRWRDNCAQYRGELSRGAAAGGGRSVPGELRPGRLRH
jgi:hypothetical protein